MELFTLSCGQFDFTGVERFGDGKLATRHMTLFRELVNRK